MKASRSCLYYCNLRRRNHVFPGPLCLVGGEIGGSPPPPKWRYYTSLLFFHWLGGLSTASPNPLRREKAIISPLTAPCCRGGRGGASPPLCFVFFCSFFLHPAFFFTKAHSFGFRVTPTQFSMWHVCKPITRHHEFWVSCFGGAPIVLPGAF